MAIGSVSLLTAGYFLRIAVCWLFLVSAGTERSQDGILLASSTFTAEWMARSLSWLGLYFTPSKPGRVGVSRPITPDHALLRAWTRKGSTHRQRIYLFRDYVAPLTDDRRSLWPAAGLYKTNQSLTKGSLGILQVRLNAKHIEEEDAWLRPTSGRGGENEDGRRPGSLSTTTAVRVRRLQKQKLLSQPQPLMQKKWEEHLSVRGPNPWRLGRRLRASGPIVLSRRRAPPLTSPG